MVTGSAGASVVTGASVATGWVAAPPQALSNIPRMSTMLNNIFLLYIASPFLKIVEWKIFS